MNKWVVALMLIVAGVLLYVVHDGRRAAFRAADNVLTARCERESNEFLNQLQKSGRKLDSETMAGHKKIMMKCATEAAKLKQRYDQGLMPDGSRYAN
jgi:hypothetical protein